MLTTQKFYQTIQDAREYRIPKRWRASEIAKCPRALYLARKGVLPLEQNAPGAGKLLRWGAGHHVESAARPYLQAIYPNLISNLKFSNTELDFVGEFDGFDPDSKTLISVKSVHNYAFKSIDGATGLKENTGQKNAKGNVVWKLRDRPYEHHIWQEHAYKLLMEHPKTVWEDRGEELTLEQLEGLWQVEQIEWLYISLEGLVQVFRSSPDPRILKRVSDKLKYLNEAYAASTLPICTCQEGQEFYQVQDQYCPFKTSAGCCSDGLLDTIKLKEVINV